jgi:hypothetical protein
VQGGGRLWFSCNCLPFYRGKIADDRVPQEVGRWCRSSRSSGPRATLGAYAANQLEWINPSQLSYTVANFVGATILTVVAIVDRQIGFALLQGAWTLVSLVSIAAILRGGGSFPTGGGTRQDGSPPTFPTRGEDLR